MAETPQSVTPDNIVPTVWKVRVGQCCLEFRRSLGVSVVQWVIWDERRCRFVGPYTSQSLDEAVADTNAALAKHLSQEADRG